MKNISQVYYKGVKVRWQLYYFLALSVLVYGTSAVSIMPELKQNVFEIWNMELILDMKGMLANLFDRLYVVTGIEIPKVSDLNLTVFQF